VAKPANTAASNAIDDMARMRPPEILAREGMT
jgi:hypothetical protein